MSEREEFQAVLTDLSLEVGALRQRCEDALREKEALRQQVATLTAERGAARDEFQEARSTSYLERAEKAEAALAAAEGRERVMTSPALTAEQALEIVKFLPHREAEQILRSHEQLRADLADAERRINQASDLCAVRSTQTSNMDILWVLGAVSSILQPAPRPGHEGSGEG